MSAPGFLQTNGAAAESYQNGIESSQWWHGTESSSKYCRNGTDCQNGLTCRHQHTAAVDYSPYLTVQDYTTTRSKPEKHPLTVQVQNPPSLTSASLLSRNSDSIQNCTTDTTTNTEDLS